MKRISIASRLGVATAALVGVLALTQPVPALAAHGGGFHGGGFHGGFHGRFRGAHFAGGHYAYSHRGGYGGWGWDGVLAPCYYPYVYSYACGTAGWRAR